MTSAPLKGRLLVASPTLTDPNFARTVVFVLEHSDDDGALGLVLNRPSLTAVAEVLPAWAPLAAEPAVAFVGGPVSPNAAICLGWVSPGAEPDGWTAIEGPLGAVDLSEDPATLAGALERVRVYAGYAGWGAAQLEAEIALGSWYVVDALPVDPFVADPSLLWRQVLRRQGGSLALVSTFPPDPALN
jgi:putative transcriptional regulator